MVYRCKDLGLFDERQITNIGEQLNRSTLEREHYRLKSRCYCDESLS